MVDHKKPIEQWGPIDSVVLYMSFVYWASGPGIAKYYRVSWPEMIIYFSNYRVTFWWDKLEMQRKGEDALSKYFLEPINLNKIKHEYSRVWKEYLSLENKILRATKVNPNKNTLKDLTQKLYRCLVDFWCVSLICEEVNYAAPEYLKKQLAGKVPAHEIPHALEILLAPIKPSFHQVEESELLEKYLTAKNKSHLEELLNNHSKKWYWVENSYYESKHLKVSDFQARLKGLSSTQAVSKVKKNKAYYKNLILNKKRVGKKYDLEQSTLKLADTFAFSIWWQDERKAKSWRTFDSIENLAIIASKLFYVPISDLMLYTAEEFMSLTQTGKPLPKKALVRRLAGSIFKINQKNYKIKEGKLVNKIIGPFLRLGEKSSSSEILTGIVVSKSKKPIKAKVRILLSPRDGEKMQKGEILIAPMTSPDFVPHMRKAAAIITDVGGLMSHAAVISRELGIACITNTKFATQIFKDGDIIEVDTNKGIIRKIK